MADLKLGTQIGGNLVWHQGILDLNPVDTKLYFQDQEVLVDTGYQTLKGTMKFNVPANQYDIESLSILPAGSKSMLRKFRGGINDTIWHETIQNTKYRISTGNTDAGLILELVHGNAATFQNSVHTNAAQSTAANSFTRKDYVDAIDNKNVAKAGDTMTGDLLFDSGSRKVRVNEIASVAAGWDAAGNSTFFKMGSYDQAKGGDLLEIRSAGAGVGNRTSGFDVRTTKNISNTPLYVGDNMVYHPANKPTPGDINAYTKAEIDTKSWLRVKDERAAMIQPSALDSKTLGLYFTNQSDVTTNWVSGFTVNGWESTYAAWSIFSSARSDTDDARLWFKYGRTAWSPSYRIYHENNKPTNVELNLVSRAGDEMTGPLTIRNSTFQCVTGWGVRRVMKQLGPQNDAKPVLVLFCPKYIGAALPKSGFVGRVTFDRGATTSNLQANYVDISAVTAYKETVAQIHYASGGTPVKLVYVTHNGVEYLAMYRVVASEATLIIDGYCYGADPILISDATGYVVTDIETRERIYSSNNKPTNVDLNLVSRAGDTLTGSLNGPDFIQTTPQSSNGAASARKDYVDAQDAMAVAKAGDTMTGALIATQFKASSDYGFVRSTNDAQGMFVGADGRTIIGGGAGALILRPQGIDNAASESVFNNDGTIAISKTGTADNHLVTKKYVDDKVGTAVQSVTATGAVKSTGGINPVISLANATNAADGAMSFADKAKLDGIPAAAVNRTGDTMTGALGVTRIDHVDLPSANQQLINADNTGRVFVGNAQTVNDLRLQTNNGVVSVTVGNAPFRIYHAGFKPTAIDVNAVGRSSVGFSSVNLNALRTSQHLRLEAAGNITNRPSDDVSYAQMIHVNGGGDTHMQILGTYNTGKLFWRGFNNTMAAGSVSWYQIYHTGFKPTADDVGAAPSGYGLGVNAPLIHDRSGFFANDAPSVAGYPGNGAGFQSTYGSNRRAQIYMNSSGAVYSRFSLVGNVIDTTTPWATHYTTLNKPTSADIGAVAKTGDTMTGTLNFARIKSAANFWDKSSIMFADGANTWFHLLSEANYFKISAGTTGQTNLMSVDSAGNMDVAGSTASNYFRTNKLGGNDAVAPYRSASQGGSFATMYNRHASFHTDVVQTGSNYAPNTSIQYQHNAGWAGMYSTGVLNNSAASPGAYCIAHISNGGGDAFTWKFDGKTGRFTSGAISVTNIDVDGSVTAGQIRTTGGLTINNISPTIALQDLDNKSGFVHVNSNQFYILRSAGNNETSFDGGPNGIHPMTMNLDNGDVTFSRNGSFNDVNIRSDIRLKSNLLPIVGALDKVYTLSGFTFDKFGCDKREAGIIAQDLKKVLPESVGSFKTTAGEEFLTVSNSGVNALLVEAIKELTDRVKYLESKIN